MYVLSEMMSIALIILIFASSSSAQGIRYVMPNSSVRDCPGEPCLNLHKYMVEQAAEYFTNGSVFIFLPGNHTLHTAAILPRISNVTLKGESDTVVLLGNEIFCENITNLVISGLKFLLALDANASDMSAWTFVRSVDIFINCSMFEGNPDFQSAGRALLLIGSNASVSNSLFKWNMVEFGGIILANSSTAILNNNTFTGNRANGEGGTLDVPITTTILNSASSVFTEDNDLKISTGYGGAILALHSTIILNSNIFAGNIANGSGGAIFSQESILVMNGNLFEGNKALENGGAIFASDSIIQINGKHVWHTNYSNNLEGMAYFSSNTANVGGAICVIDCTLTFSGSAAVVFSGNSAQRLGGALASVGSFRECFIGSSLVVEAHQMYFKSNTAQERGGAISLQKSCFVITNSNSSTEFAANSAESGGAIFSSDSQILAEVGEMTFLNNSAQEFGGALGVIVDFQEHEKVVIISANFINNTAGICGGAGDIVGKGITFVDTMAKGNSDSALCITGDLKFTGSTNFSKNTGGFGGAIYIHPESHVSFTGHTVFEGNSAGSGGAIYALNEVRVSFKIYILFSHNTAHADGGAIYAFKANITFHPSTIINILYHSAQNGGAIYMGGGTSMMFMEQVVLATAHNHAFNYGGVMYYEDDPATTQCEYKSLDAEVSEFHKLPYCSINFALVRSIIGQVYANCLVKSYNDSSDIDGSFIYGGLLDRCSIGTKHWLMEKDGAVVPFKIILKNFQVEPVESVRTITSQPYQLCFCSKHNHVYSCTETITNIETNRGQMFAISLLALDQVRTSISTQITAKVRGIGRLKSKQSYQTLLPNCSELRYTMYSAGDSEELILYPDGPCRDNGLARAVVNVTLLPCPSGFMKSMEKCVCEDRLEKYGANCTIREDVSITRGPDSRLWISALFNNATYQGLILYHTCPVEYCTMEIVPVDLDNPDIQCANNRSGMLCGTCASNYSLMLGSFRCGECSNTYLALLLPFAAAGIALVVFLSILRLTVATGMINSVILYANIVQAKRGIFFPSNKVNVLTVFIAWMNLDLGFETCFYNGLTAYAATWFQFAFPFYVWMIISVIILTSKYSLTVSKWIGRNPIAVLATLLLMSYTKILKIIIDVYRSANLDYPEEKEVTRWLKDANVDYLHTKHLALSLVTSLVFHFIFLPYTLLLLLGYKLYRFSDRRLFRWLNRLKPLLDSYYAPYNKRTRYWTGFLLLVRCALYGTFSFGETRSLLAICVTFTLILAYKCLLPGKVHSNSYNNILEIVVYTNLIILATTTSAGVSSAALVYSLVGTVFSIMMGVIFYQFYSTYIAGSAFANKLRSMKLRRIQEEPVAEQAPAKKIKTTAISSTIIELREPLLDD